jgi:hypothetical protein
VKKGRIELGSEGVKDEKKEGVKDEKKEGVKE